MLAWLGVTPAAITVAHGGTRLCRSDAVLSGVSCVSADASTDASASASASDSGSAEEVEGGPEDTAVTVLREWVTKGVSASRHRGDHREWHGCHLRCDSAGTGGSGEGGGHCGLRVPLPGHAEAVLQAGAVSGLCSILGKW